MSKKESKVIISKINEHIKDSIKDIFNNLGGISNFIPNDKVIIKVNGVHYTDYSYTDPRVLDAFVKYYIDNGVNPQDIFVIENCTSGLFTRAVFRISGLEKVCKDNKVNIIYMDEGDTTKIKLGKEQYEVEISKFAFEELLIPNNRKNNIFIEIPKLKTHWCTKITLGIKLLLGMLRDNSKAIRHHYYHEERLVDIFEKFRPDLCLVDGINGVAVGPCPPQNPDILPDYIYDYNILFGGTDIVSVDAVGGMLLGLDNLEVPTTRIAHERGLGIGDINKIKIITIPEFDINKIIKKVPWELKNIFPDNVKLIYGKELACYQGCVGLTLIYLELLTLENPEIKDSSKFTLLFGKGFDENELNDLIEPIGLVGKCCIENIGKFIKNRYKNILEAKSCGNLGDYCNLIFKITGIDPLSQIPTDKISIQEILWLYLIAVTNKLEASLPDLPTEDEILDLLSTSLDSLSKDLLIDPDFKIALEKLFASPNEKVRANTIKLAINMAKIINKEYLEFAKHGLLDESKRVIKTTLKEIQKVSKQNKELLEDIRPNIEKLEQITDNESIKKLCSKILSL